MFFLSGPVQPTLRGEIVSTYVTGHRGTKKEGYDQYSEMFPMKHLARNEVKNRICVLILTKTIVFKNVTPL